MNEFKPITTDKPIITVEQSDSPNWGLVKLTHPVSGELLSEFLVPIGSRIGNAALKALGESHD